MSFSVRCRYCRDLLLAEADQLGEREAASIRAHLPGCYPNVGRLPHTIGELLRHLSVTIAAPRPTLERPVTPSVPAPGTAPAVLIVAEHGRMRTVLAARLGAERLGVALAADAVDALRWLHTEPTPCVIVVDADRGVKLASWLTHHPDYGRIVVLGIRSYEDPEAAGAPTGVARVFALPADEDALVEAIVRLRVRR